MRRFLRVLVNFIMLFVMLGSLFILAYDCYMWAIKPLFTGKFIMLTYYGMFTDFIAIWCYYTAKNYFEVYYENLNKKHK